MINGIMYHQMEAMTEGAFPANAYAIIQVHDNGWVTVTGYDTQETYSIGVPRC